VAFLMWRPIHKRQREEILLSLCQPILSSITQVAAHPLIILRVVRRLESLHLSLIEVARDSRPLLTNDPLIKFLLRLTLNNRNVQEADPLANRHVKGLKVGPRCLSLRLLRLYGNLSHHLEIVEQSLLVLVQAYGSVCLLLLH
jgi:hypothetical protein